VELLEEAYSYSFDQEPFYGKIKFIMEKMLMKIGLPPTRNFEWGIIPQYQDSESNVYDSDE
jgi:hypothetical protein